MWFLLVKISLHFLCFFAKNSNISLLLRKELKVQRFDQYSYRHHATRAAIFLELLFKNTLVVMSSFIQLQFVPLIFLKWNVEWGKIFKLFFKSIAVKNQNLNKTNNNSNAHARVALVSFDSIERQLMCEPKQKNEVSNFKINKTKTFNFRIRCSKSEFRRYFSGIF